MPKITFKQAKEFLEKINNKDKVAIIHHDDSDGYCSGILFYNWCESKNAKVKNFIFKFGEWDRKINLNSFNKIIITDIAPTGIEEISPPLNKKIFYTDHHPQKQKTPKEILELRTTHQGYVPSSRTTQELIGIKPWLGLAGTISDYGHLHKINEKYIEKNLKKYNLTFDQFKENISNVISNVISFFGEDKQKAFDEIVKINSINELRKLRKYSDTIEKEIIYQTKKIEKKIEKIENVNIATINNSKFSIKGIIIGKMSIKNPDQIFIFISPKKSNPNILGIASRHNSDKANLPELLNAGINGLKNANAGGHKRAAGAQIQKKDLEKFKENIKNYIISR